MKAGAPGATYYYGRGTGVRQKLGVLSKLIVPEKEVILIVTKKSQTDAVFAAVIKAGKLDKKGQGFAYIHKIDRAVGFLEDYAFTIEAFIQLYEVTFEEKWLNKANELMQYAITHFRDDDTHMFFFTSNMDSKLIARKMEINDNVIPASNSSMAISLFLLGHHFDNNDYHKQSEQMLRNVVDQMPSYGAGYSNWAILLLNDVRPFYEIAISGKNANQLRDELNTHY